MPMDEFAEKVLKDSLRAILYRVEISELNIKKEDFHSGGWDFGERFMYTGNLPRAIAKLTDYSIARIKTIGQVPDKSISYWGERYNSDYEGLGRKIVKPKKRKKITQENLAESINSITKQQNQSDPANIMILNVLKMTYGFTVTDIEDTCEVWVAKVIDKENLSAFFKFASSGGSGPKDIDGKHYFELSSHDLSSIWESIEVHSKHIVYDETDDSRRFELLIENKFNDFDTANEVLFPFGLRLFKEKRLEKLKLVEFHE